MSLKQRNLSAVLLFLLAAGAPALAQIPSNTKDASKGFALIESFQGSRNSEGQVYILNSSVGYNFNRFFGVFTGLPVYLVRTSSSISGTTSSSTNSGIGNFYVGLRLSLNNPLVNYSSTLTGWAPTGDTNTGLSTGRATFDWDNRLDRGFSNWTPFLDLGVGNTITDTRFFRRPFTSLGRVAHFEAGTDLTIFPAVSIGASAYDIEPWGQQRVFSRLVQRQSGLPGGTPGTSGRGRVFETSAETIGTADLTRDHGFNGWVEVKPVKALAFELGYSRSVRYALNTVSFGVVVNLSSLVNRRPGP